MYGEYGRGKTKMKLMLFAAFLSEITREIYKHNSIFHINILKGKQTNKDLNVHILEEKQAEVWDSCKNGSTNSSTSRRRSTRIDRFSTFVLHGKLMSSFGKLLRTILQVFRLLLSSA